MAIIEDLIKAIRDGNPDINVIQDLITKLLQETNDINTKDKAGDTALIWAAVGGRTNVVKLLLQQKGIDVNLTDKDGKTALHLAAKGGRRDVVQLLLVQEGIDVNVKNTHEETALYWAVLMVHTEVVKLLLQNGADITNAIDLILEKEWGNSFLVNLFKASYLNYSAKELLSILQDIWSSVNFTEDKKSEF